MAAHRSEVHAGVQCGAIDVAAVDAQPGRTSSRPPSGDRSRGFAPDRGMGKCAARGAGRALQLTLRETDVRDRSVTRCALDRDSSDPGSFSGRGGVPVDRIIVDQDRGAIVGC
jgi:hypothetical protein